MWGAPSSAGWRHSATTWSQWSGTSKPQAGRLPSGIALRVADYEDASALKRALAGIDDMVLISRRRKRSHFLVRAMSGSPADCIAGSPFPERHRSGTDILEFTIPRWLCIMHR